MGKIKNENEAVASLHRYYHCSVEMKYQFAEVWKGPLPTDPSVIYSNDQILQSIYAYMYMSLWLAFLNSVIEGWAQIKLKDKKIEGLLKQSYIKNIKIFRHSVFHYQQNYWAKMAEKHLATKGFLGWAQDLDTELERWFRDHPPNIKH